MLGGQFDWGGRLQKSNGDVYKRQMQYGAKGDGKTNDAFSIQHAIDDCAKNGGGQVVLPSGYTFYSDSIRLKKKMCIRDSDANEPLMQARLYLCSAVKNTIYNILTMLKITTPEVM